jgi:hypothetical protein
MEALMEVGTVPQRAVGVSIACSIVCSVGDSVVCRSVLDIGATCWSPNIVWCWAYKIVGTDNVLMPAQHNKHGCCVGPS